MLHTGIFADIWRSSHCERCTAAGPTRYCCWICSVWQCNDCSVVRRNWSQQLYAWSSQFCNYICYSYSIYAVGAAYQFLIVSCLPWWAEEKQKSNFWFDLFVEAIQIDSLWESVKILIQYGWAVVCTTGTDSDTTDLNFEVYCCSTTLQREQCIVCDSVSVYHWCV